MSDRSKQMQRDREIAEGRYYRPEDIAGSLRQHVSPAPKPAFEPRGFADEPGTRLESAPDAKRLLADVMRIAAQVLEAYPELPGVVSGMTDIRAKISALL